ncbi:MAG: HlyC/CorC family transporter [Methanospirillum sp.]|nr:HlyC/CorC family transporter [Methanospirillum sp.]
MSELAIVSARRHRLQVHAEAGDARAGTAIELADEPNRFLSTVQIGITVIGVLSGAYGGTVFASGLADIVARVPALAPYAQSIALAAVVLLITYLTLVIGEIVPKRLALANPEAVALRVARPMQTLSLVSAPVVALLSASTDLVLRLLGAREVPGPSVTEEEVRILLQEGTSAGVFDEEEQELVDRVFRLSDRRVASLMTPRHEIVGVDLSDQMEENIARMRESGHSYFPVYRDDLDHVVGMVSVQSLWASARPGSLPDVESAIFEPLYLPESLPALKVMAQFRGAATHVALVTDEYGSVEGLLTLHDLLESIVGTLPGTPGDEPDAVRRDDGSWLVDGLLPVAEFRERFNLPTFPGEERGYYQTLGGFVMMHLERSPVAGDRFDLDGNTFEVLDMDGNRVDKVLYTPPGAGEEGD